MATVTLRPTSTAPSDFTIVGAATAHAATSDQSDASYATNQSLGVVSVGLVLAPSAVLIASTISGITFHVRAKKVGAGSFSGVGFGTTGDVVTLTPPSLTTSFADYQVGSAATRTVGDAWTYTNLAINTFALSGTGTGSDYVQLAELWMVVTYSTEYVGAVPVGF